MKLVNSILAHFSFDSKERFYFAYEDDCGNFQFESCYIPLDLDQGFEIHQLFCPNSFYRRTRSIETLRTLYALWMDIDGICDPFPLSHIDILERWHQLGFSKPPTEIICTSPGHYHVILRLKPLRAFPEKISYWENCQKGITQLFKDLGADYQPPTGFIRIPGHRNYKHPEKPMVESVLQSNSIFTLSEIYEILKENGIKKRNGAASTVEAKIKILLEGRVAYGKRNRACFTLAIYFNKNLWLSQEQATERLLEWNTRLPEPLKAREIAKSVRSAYKGDYSVSTKWLKYHTEDEHQIEIQKSYQVAKPKKVPLRISLDAHADRIRDHILSCGGVVEVSQRKFAQELGIPFESLRKTLRLLGKEINITVNGKGRNTTTTIALRECTEKRVLRIVS